MGWLDGIRWVVKALNSNRQRTLLTTLGIAIGIMAVTLLTSIGEGLRVYLLDSFSQFGTRIIAVTPGKVTTQGMAGMLNSIRPLTIEDSEALRDLPYVEYVVPLVTGTAEVEAGRFRRHSNVLAVGHEGARAWKMRVAQGQFLPQDDPVAARAHAVLGARLKRELFGARSPLGEWVRVGGVRFRVVGVMESKGQMLGFDLDDVVYIPVARGLQLFNRASLMEVDVVFSELASSADMARRIGQRLQALHRVEDVTLFTQEDMLSSLDNILGFVTLTIGALGGISLLVGAVGILTIMTTALHERTAEIGLLCAVGASRGQILMLFLGEAILLALAGGALGVGLAGGLILAAHWLLPNLPLQLSVIYVMFALLLAMLVGLLSGIAPALHAARLNPIEALHSD
ncbi:MAG: FtsX-like permease family protein [Gammaproteobacteria bacterium]|nr:FtsX-like permease family protein [Gammaproteobacteria bacterium]